MSGYHKAVNSVGTEVLVIKDNKIIGEGVSVIAHGNNYCGIEFMTGPIVDMVKDFECVKMLGLRYVWFRYSPISGMYLGTGFLDDNESEPILGDTYVVDSFNLRFGMVPDTFKNVAGYRSAYDSESYVAR